MMASKLWHQRRRSITMAWLVTTLIFVVGLSDRLHIIGFVEANQNNNGTTTSLDTYLVNVPSKFMPSNFPGDARGWYTTLLALISDTNATTLDGRFVYVYRHVFEGFAVRLTPREAQLLGQLREVAMVVKDLASIKLHTTRTPTFLDLQSMSSTGIGTVYDDGPLWNASRRGADTIVGVLDTGIWPERPSFSNDAGFGPIPPRWKGACDSYLPSFNASAACNLKLIGARAFFSGYEAGLGGPMDENLEFRSPRDSDGHGTHTASTAVGSPVPGSSFLGFAPGTASGMAPLSRLAVYKVCWSSGCYNSDILAGFEAAISDGVDIISLSVGDDPSPYSSDPIALGAFAASRFGILTSCSAGNEGPSFFTVSNVAPWIFTIAASSVDRDFPASVTLGNGEILAGTSLYSGGPGTNSLPLVYAARAAAFGADPAYALFCNDTALLDSSLISGKIVMCYTGNASPAKKAFVVGQAGGLGMILANYPLSDGEMLLADPFPLPALRIGYKASLAILQYLNSTANPTAILKNGVTTELGMKRAPAMAAFSSRGPNSVTPGIMKPDITAPGLNILAAWTGEVTASPVLGQAVEFNIISGTSMSCPHVSGIAALLKSAHWDWSPAMIRSALMTTAKKTDNTGQNISDTYTGEGSNPTAFGAGHINPNAALDPGLVYDISPQTYVDFVCGLNSVGPPYFDPYTTFFCDSSSPPSPTTLGSTPRPIDLNTPSLFVTFNETSDSRPFTPTTSRTLTNVGPLDSTNTYNLVSITTPTFLTVSVTPTVLTFDALHRNLPYSVTFTFSASNTNFISFGSLTWSDGVHNVTSPISFFVTQ